MAVEFLSSEIVPAPPHQIEVLRAELFKHQQNVPEDQRLQTGERFGNDWLCGASGDCTTIAGIAVGAGRIGFAGAGIRFLSRTSKMPETESETPTKQHLQDPHLDRIFEQSVISFLKPHRRTGNFSAPSIRFQRNPNNLSLFEWREDGD
jgi:hypothetical protein